MKKIKSMAAFLGVSVLAFSMIFSGCSGKSNEKQNAGQATGNQTEQTAGAAEKQGVKYPTKAVQIIVPAKAGGATDISARVVAQYLEKELGQSFVIVNVDGAGGSVASRKVKDSPNDGYNLLWAHNGIAVNKLMNVTDYSYDAFESGPILVQDYSNGIFSSSKGKYKDFKTLVEEAKKNPGKITYGTEFGSFTHLQGLALADALGIEFNIVDVGPDAQKRTALLGGQIDIAPGLFGTYKPQVDSGDFNYLSVLPAERFKFAPDVPTVKELGYNFSFDGYAFGFHLPKNTPKEIVEVLANAMEKISKDQAFQKDMENKYLAVSYKSPEESAKYWKELQASYDKYKEKMLANQKK